MNNREPGRRIRLFRRISPATRLSIRDFMPELNDFYNEGSGWICRHCEREFERDQKSEHPDPANRPLAKWTDKTRRFLTCPRCGITEPAELS